MVSKKERKYKEQAASEAKLASSTLQQPYDGWMPLKPTPA